MDFITTVCPHVPMEYVVTGSLILQIKLYTQWVHISYYTFNIQVLMAFISFYLLYCSSIS